MINKPLVSIILPCYNASSFLDAALKSIIKQSYKNLEIIVIDDGSSDDSSKIYSIFKEQDNRVIVLKNKENKGLIFSLNKGIKQASGDYIARMDADDISHQNRIEKQLEYMLNHKDIVVLGTNASIINTNDKIIQTNSLDFYTQPETLSFSSYFTQPFYHGSIIARANTLKENLYSSDYKHSEDFELWLRINSKEKKMANISEVLYFYRDNNKGVSNTFSDFQIKNHNKASYKYLNEVISVPIKMKVVGIINNRPSENISINDIKQSLKTFKRIYLQLAKSDTIELKKYYIRQKLNIIIQAVKKTKSLSVKLYLLTSNLDILFSIIGFQFILKKMIK